MRFIFNKLERLVLGLSFLSILFLAFIQFLSYDNNYIVYASRIDGRFIFNPFPNRNSPKKGIIVLENMNPDYKKIHILINGNPIKSFINHDKIEIYVYDNDVIEADGTKYNEELSVKVIGTSSNVDTSELNPITTMLQNIEIIGRVQLK